MQLPFTREQFFDVFAAYNLAVWPAQLVLAAVALALILGVLAKPRRAGPWTAYGLALLWTWTGLVYHLGFFRTINPAAPLFAALCLGTAIVFVVQGAVRGGLSFRTGLHPRALPGWLMIAYALLGYPVIGAMAGHTFPAAPTFGLPCPTTLFTVGLLLLAAPGMHRSLVIGPMIWSLIGGTAALALGVPQDYGLLVAAAICAYLLLARPKGSRPATAGPGSRRWM